jgi:predicted ester cyclase
MPMPRKTTPEFLQALEANKRLIARFYEELDAAKPDQVSAVVDKYIADDFDSHEFVPGLPVRTKQQFKAYQQEVASTMPDRRSNPHLFLADEDLVMLYKTTRAHHTHGNVFGKEATGTQLDFPEVKMFRLRDGKIVEHWSMVDYITPMTQLGALQYMSVFPALSDEYAAVAGVPHNGWQTAEPPKYLGQTNLEELPPQTTQAYFDRLIDNKKMIATFYSLVEDWSGQDGHQSAPSVNDVMGKYVATDFKSHSFLPGVPVSNWDQYGRVFEILRETQPNRRSEFHQFIAEGDIVMLYKTNHNLFERGVFFGVEGAGQRVDVPAVKIFRVTRGRFSEHWHVMDFATTLNCLGSLPDGQMFPRLTAEYRRQGIACPARAVPPPPATTIQTDNWKGGRFEPAPVRAVAR